MNLTPNLLILGGNHHCIYGSIDGIKDPRRVLGVYKKLLSLLLVLQLGVVGKLRRSSRACEGHLPVQIQILSLQSTLFCLCIFLEGFKSLGQVYVRARASQEFLNDLGLLLTVILDDPQAAGVAHDSIFVVVLVDYEDFSHCRFAPD